MSKTYSHYCATARALEVVGERWTILVLRELLLGPRRYTDLQRDLPGIGPNLLTARLRTLEHHGVVHRRTLPPPAASSVYELTALGEGLRPAIIELTRWGAQLLGPPRPGEEFRLSWLLMRLQASFRPQLAGDARFVHEFHVDGEIFHLAVGDGELTMGSGPAKAPDCTLETDLETFLALGAKQLGLEEAGAAGLVQVTGDHAVGRLLIDLVGPHLDDVSDGGGIVGATASYFAPAAAAGLRGVIEIAVEDRSFKFALGPDGVTLDPEGAITPALRLTCELRTLLRIGLGRESPLDAVAAGRLTVDGDAEFVAELTAVLQAGRDGAGDR